jgi:hypothetical protein
MADTSLHVDRWLLRRGKQREDNLLLGLIHKQSGVSVDLLYTNKPRHRPPLSKTDHDLILIAWKVKKTTS